VKTYSSLSEAPKNLQVALSKRKIEPKGAFQVFMAEDPQAFYDTYVTVIQNHFIVIDGIRKNGLAINCAACFI
ncbi:Agglutinin receptor, partial [human gut metagenome]